MDRCCRSGLNGHALLSGDNAFLDFLSIEKLAVAVVFLLEFWWKLHECCCLFPPFVVHLFSVSSCGGSCVGRLVFWVLRWVPVWCVWWVLVCSRAHLPLSAFLYPHALFALRCFGRVGSGFVCLVLLRRGCFPIFQIFLRPQSLAGMCMSTACIGSLEFLDVLLNGLGWSIYRHSRGENRAPAKFHRSSLRTRAQRLVRFLYGLFFLAFVCARCQNWHVSCHFTYPSSSHMVCCSCLLSCFWMGIRPICSS